MVNVDYYAFLDDNNIVTEVIVGRERTETVDGIVDWEVHYSEIRNQPCLLTSFDGSIRKNFAGIGFSYDPERDAFISPKPYDSWALDEKTCNWTAPNPRPENRSNWNEETLSWEELT
jgi:hypothetical protein